MFYIDALFSRQFYMCVKYRQVTKQLSNSPSAMSWTKRCIFVEMMEMSQSSLGGLTIGKRCKQTCKAATMKNLGDISGHKVLGHTPHCYSPFYWDRLTSWLFQVLVIKVAPKLIPSLTPLKVLLNVKCAVVSHWETLLKYRSFSFWFLMHVSIVGPTILHIYWIFRWCWCYLSGNNLLRIIPLNHITWICKYWWR